MADNIELKNNLMSFRETFREYTDYNTVIGGTACMILMEEASRDFRATKDVDMILIMEDGGKEFCKTFWEYILRGKYTCGWKDSEPHYYRFTEPRSGFPSQIELFSRRADFELDSRIIPFKMYAWLNNINLKKRGEKVNSDDIKKHKNDVFRLLPLINPDVKIQTGGNVRGTVLSFIEKMGPEAVADEFLSNGRTKEETLDILKNVYL